MLDILSIRLIYSSGFKVGKPSAEATATHITAEELPLLAIVWAGVFAERTNESPSLKVLLIPVFSASVNSPLSIWPSKGTGRECIEHCESIPLQENLDG